MQLATEMRRFEQSARHDAAAEWLGRWPPSAIHSEHDSISIARSERDLRDIGALRYELYVERDGKRYGGADHGARTFLEPIDAVSLNFQARIDGRLLAAVRGVRAEDAMHDPHLRLLLAEIHVDDIDTAVVCSRFAVRSEHRARAMIKPMFQHVYRAGILSGGRDCILGARADLVGIFERFGFRQTRAHVVDPIANDIKILTMDMHDLSHMRRVNSPLIEISEMLLDTMSVR